jgi:hypothetical protein
MVADPDPDPHQFELLDPDLDPHSNSDPAPDPGGQKYPQEVQNFHVLKCWMFSFES